jgi:hypothetical protein
MTNKIYFSYGQDEDKFPLFWNCGENFQDVFSSWTLLNKKYFWIQKATVGGMIDWVLYAFTTNGRTAVEINPETEKELKELCEWCDEKKCFHTILLDCNSPLQKPSYEKHGFMIMNRWFDSGKDLLEFYIAHK